MFFRVTVRNVEAIIGRLNVLKGAFRSAAVWAEIGAFLRKQILVRTAKGEDADSMPFAPYSHQYALFRKEKGRSVGKVNLFFSGTMLSSIDYIPTDHGVRLYFLPTEAPPVAPKTDRGKPKESPASPLKAYYIQTHKTKPREFFGFSKADVEEIVKKMLARVDQAGV